MVSGYCIDQQNSGGLDAWKQYTMSVSLSTVFQDLAQCLTGRRHPVFAEWINWQDRYLKYLTAWQKHWPNIIGPCTNQNWHRMCHTVVLHWWELIHYQPRVDDLVQIVHISNENTASKKVKRFVHSHTFFIAKTRTRQPGLNFPPRKASVIVIH